jgi:hypothetical protein
MIVNPMEAQTARVQFKVQTEEGNDSVILRRVIIKSQSPYEMQKRINVLFVKKCTLPFCYMNSV